MSKKIAHIVLYGFFGAPFLVVGLLIGAAYNATKTGWLWADKILNT
jgi:hypothetical protein